MARVAAPFTGNPQTGKVIGKQTIRGTGVRAVPVKVQAPTFAQRGRTLRVTIPLAAGRLDPASIAPSNTSIDDGRASFALWQGGILSSARPRTSGHGLTIGMRQTSAG